MGQAKLTSTIGTSILFEAGYSFSRQNWSLEVQEGVAEERGTPAWFAKASRQDRILRTRRVAGPSSSFFDSTRNVVSSSLSYVTGSHAVKTGVQWNYGPRSGQRLANADLVQRYRNGVPSDVIVYNTPNNNEVTMDADLGLYVQDSWRMDNLTVNAGVRFDYYKATIPANTVQGGALRAGAFVP